MELRELEAHEGNLVPEHIHLAAEPRNLGYAFDDGLEDSRKRAGMSLRASH